MKIKKTGETVPSGKIVNSRSTSQADTYSCNYVNNAIDSIEPTGDTLPVNSVIRYDGNVVPDGYVEVADTSNDCSLGLTALNKEHATTSWNAVNIMSDFTQGFKKGNDIYFDDNKIKIASNATITWIDINLYIKWSIPYPSDPGNRGIYIYKNGTRITTEFNGTLASSTEWHCDTYELMTEVSPGDYFEIYIVRGGYSSSITTTIEHAYLKVNSLI